ncbi:serine hydrolase [Marilutibacter chinensis]|uniref:Serine hydrolase n=1 Tax=Marilutibacter chinensis TaxID=2912247 RepID=A0ABS9HY94_9GAMM|nr:serine hydrolase [Lysobacter chinensis]MCF7221247.1 serine hydrolase [Lysobacter chinensis]MCF7223012.1 serine hydrolase [Lysobacter chinensis]
MSPNRPRTVSSLVAPLLAAALAVPAGACAASPSAATGGDALRTTVEKRLLGDRTGACFAVAVIDGTGDGDFDVRRTFACADGSTAPRIGPASAFEIGSVTKTMTAALLAGLIEAGQADLDDPLAGYLPGDVRVPTFEGQPVRLRHLVTHTSGLPALPPGVEMSDPTDPYAAITADDLLAALGRSTLAQAPGERFEYSNFASMLLSYAIARRAGEDLETLLDTRVFTPLGMGGAYINDRPQGIEEAAGHLPSGKVTPAWRFRTDLAGVGGVRATLDDMVAYVRGQLGAAPEPLAAAIGLTQQPLSTPSAQPIAMNWMLAPLDGRTVHAHEGGTGGFSSFVAFDRERRRGVIVLSDTAMTTLGGLGSLGQHLLDARLPLGAPRKATAAPPTLIEALVGDWQLQGGPAMTLRRNGDALEIQATGQPAFAMGYDSAGDFYPLAFDALLSPQKGADGSYRFVWHQGGGVLAARRIDANADAAPTLTAEALEAYAGEYPLDPTDLVLSVRVQGDALFAQATGQGAFPLTPVKDDVFEAAAYGIEIRFRRGDDGAVDGLTLLQGGQTLRGVRR